MAELKAGADVRILLAHAEEQAAKAKSITETPDRLRGQVLNDLKQLKAELVADRLKTIPTSRLGEATGGRLRVGALESAGLTTVEQVWSTSKALLQTINGVGPQTASQAIAAANQIAMAVERDVSVRPNPDTRPAGHTSLILGLWELDRAERLTQPVQEGARALLAELHPLIDQARPASNAFQLFFKGAKTKAAALTSAEALRRGLRNVQDFLRELASIQDQMASPIGSPDSVWDDFVRRAAEYYGLLGELGDTDLDIEAGQGFFPAEIAARVGQLQLDDSFLRVSLRGYQSFGAKFALVQGKTILGDEMGLGKTIEALAALGHLCALGSTHFLTVCPASVLINWTQEIATKSLMSGFRLHGQERDANLRIWVKRGGIAVTTFETLRNLRIPDELEISMLVVDEAHYLKNPTALRSKTTMRWVDRANRTLFLTGTPMENRLTEFQNLIRYLQPEVAKSFNPADSVAGPNAFRRSIAPVYLRRNQEDVLAELPERIEMSDWVEFGPGDFVAYREAVASGNFMAMRRAAFLTNSTKESAKMQRLTEIVDESAANGWKVVIFSFFLEVLRTVRANLAAPTLGPLTGSVNPVERQKLVDDFTNARGTTVLVSQIQAGGVGLNMQAGSVVILTEPQWKPTMEEQAIARCHRMGQVRRVRVHRLLAQDSVDQRMLEILDVKSKLFRQYVRESALKDATPLAVDISEVEAARQIVAMEQQRLGLVAQ